MVGRVVVAGIVDCTVPTGIAVVPADAIPVRMVVPQSGSVPVVD